MADRARGAGVEVPPLGQRGAAQPHRVLDGRRAGLADAEMQHDVDRTVPLASVTSRHSITAVPRGAAASPRARRSAVARRAARSGTSSELEVVVDARRVEALLGGGAASPPRRPEQLAVRVAEELVGHRAVRLLPPVLEPVEGGVGQGEGRARRRACEALTSSRLMISPPAPLCSTRCRLRIRRNSTASAPRLSFRAPTGASSPTGDLDARGIEEVGLRASRRRTRSRSNVRTTNSSGRARRATPTRCVVVVVAQLRCPAHSAIRRVSPHLHLLLVVARQVVVLPAQVGTTRGPPPSLRDQLAQPQHGRPRCDRTAPRRRTAPWRYAGADLAASRRRTCGGTRCGRSACPTRCHAGVRASSSSGWTAARVGCGGRARAPAGRGRRGREHLAVAAEQALDRVVPVLPDADVERRRRRSRGHADMIQAACRAVLASRSAMVGAGRAPRE